MMKKSLKVVIRKTQHEISKKNIEEEISDPCYLEHLRHIPNIYLDNFMSRIGRLVLENFEVTKEALQKVFHISKISNNVKINKKKIMSKKR